MTYRRLKCPKGHSFMASVYSRYQKIECPYCQQQAAGDLPVPDFTVSSTDLSSSDSPTSSDSFSSGGGGDCGGGGASGDW